MAATATARSTAPARRAPVKRAPARKPAARTSAGRRRRQHTPSAGFVVPAALRTAGAVGGLADSGVVVRLTRGRLWIGMLAALLVGIVALNVLALSFNASSSEAGRAADELKRQNSAYRAQIAEVTASDQVHQTAGRLGLHVPNPDQIGYLRPSPEDAATAAKRLRDGELGVAEYAPATEVVLTEAPVEPTTEVDADAAATESTQAAPATETPVAPEAPATAAVASGGGVSSP
jgi:hypothetical protein